MATLAERIEAAFDEAVGAKRRMQINLRGITELEETAKMENLDEWVGAKNNDVRRAIVLRDLAEDEDYDRARFEYDNARDRYRLALLEIERLKLLVALEAGS